MRSTLLFLPHEIAGIPLFGLGWALIALAIWMVIGAVLQARVRGNWKGIVESLPMWGIAIALVVFVFPRMETAIEGIDGDVRYLGVPLRGYGLMLMLGTISGIGLTAYRARQIGFSLDHLLSLAVMSCIGGIVGARLFYVVQKWATLPGESFQDKLIVALQFTEGGLVVYGGMFGGLATALIWSRVKGYRFLGIADLIAPGFLLGVAFGRLGCLLHGCCFGGLCLDPNLPSIQFPRASEPYLAQLVSGQLLGIEWERSDIAQKQARRIASVASGSWAESVGLKKGQIIDEIDVRLFWPAEGQDPAGPQDVQVQLTVDGKKILNPLPPLPSKALPLHPAQLYASINGLLISLVLFFFWPIPKRVGSVIALGLLLYGIARIIEEVVRADEVGQFGTSLTISQWISIAGILTASGILIYQRTQPTGRSMRGH